MSDEDLRALERDVMTGSQDARMKLRAMLARLREETPWHRYEYALVDFAQCPTPDNLTRVLMCRMELADEIDVRGERVDLTSRMRLPSQEELRRALEACMPKTSHVLEQHVSLPEGERWELRSARERP